MSHSSHSMVWNYFKKCDTIEAICSLCSKKLKLAGGTTNMRQHLKYIHPECWSEENDQKLISSRSSSRAVRTTIRPRRLLRQSPTPSTSSVEVEDANVSVLPTNSVSSEICSRSSPTSSRQRILLEVQAKVPRNKPTRNVTNKERELEMELLRLEVYKSKLQCRKLEIELNIPKSDLTSEIEDPHIVILNPSEFQPLDSDTTPNDENTNT